MVYCCSGGPFFNGPSIELGLLPLVDSILAVGTKVAWGWRRVWFSKASCKKGKFWGFSQPQKARQVIWLKHLPDGIAMPGNWVIAVEFRIYFALWCCGCEERLQLPDTEHLLRQAQIVPLQSATPKLHELQPLQESHESKWIKMNQNESWIKDPQSAPWQWHFLGSGSRFFFIRDFPKILFQLKFAKKRPGPRSCHRTHTTRVSLDAR